MALCRSKVSRRANLALVPLTVFLLSNVGHAAPPTAITTCPFVITEPGQYYVANDLLGCRGLFIETVGIDIQASHVHLRLNGHTISAFRPTVIGAGIRAIDQTDILIQGPGTITGFPDGLEFSNVDFSTVIRVTARGNRVGLSVFHGSNNLLQGNEVTENDRFGIEIIGSSENKVISNLVTPDGFVFSPLGTGIALLGGAELNEVHANIVNRHDPSRPTEGIFVQRFSTQNSIAGNTAVGNDLDMLDQNPDCDENQWRGNRFDTAIPTSCIQ